MRLILLGAPGAGKGTQANFIEDKYDIPTFGTGNILREAVAQGTDTGKKAKSYMDAGKLVPDEIIIQVIKDRLEQPDANNGFILDGVPRTLAQAEALQQMGVNIDLAISIQISDDTIIERLSGRRVCEKCGASYHIVYNTSKDPAICDRCGGKLVIREDDKPETVKARLKTYHEQTAPLIEYYRDRDKLAVVQSAEKVEDTTAQVMKVLEGLK